MGIFDKIKNAIWGSAQAAEASSNSTASNSTAAVPSAAPTPKPSAPPSGAAPTTAPRPSAPTVVDVTAILDSAVKASGQRLNWRTSIVDLMKALDLESDLACRTELANELGYTGNTSDSAKMNIWLHDAVMKKLAANGGNVPTELRN